MTFAFLQKSYQQQFELLKNNVTCHHYVINDKILYMILFSNIFKNMQKNT